MTVRWDVPRSAVPRRKISVLRYRYCACRPIPAVLAVAWGRLRYTVGENPDTSSRRDGALGRIPRRVWSSPFPADGCVSLHTCTSTVAIRRSKNWGGPGWKRQRSRSRGRMPSCSRCCDVLRGEDMEPVGPAATFDAALGHSGSTIDAAIVDIRPGSTTSPGLRGSSENGIPFMF